MGLLLAICILSSFYLTPVAMRLAWKYDAVSRPDGFRKKHSRPTPEWGGLAVNASVLLGLIASHFLLPDSSTDVPFLAAMSVSIVILCLIGCYDDLFDMRAGIKLAGQLLAVAPLVAVGCYAQRLSVFGLSIELGWFGVPWTIAWIVLGINALNLIDGMDGLASTVGITVAVGVAMVAGATGNTHVAVIAVVLAGALAGFLVHNLPPARIYLGDCGSMVIGLVLATLAFRVTPQPGTPNLTVMIALLFVPLYDTTLAIVRRGINGKGVMVADRGHIHHRLLDRGFGVWASLALLGTLSVTACLASCLTVFMGQDLIALVALMAVALLCANFDLFGRTEWTMVKERMALPTWRRKAGGYDALAKNRPTRGVAMSTASEVGARQEQVDGLLRGRPSLPMGINARMGGAQRANVAPTGKKYVELLG